MGNLRIWIILKKHPEMVKYIPVKDDPLGRKSVMAMVKGEKANSKKNRNIDWAYGYCRDF